MEDYILILILVLIVLLIVIFTNKHSEKFDSQKGIELSNIPTGSKTFDDPLFNDVAYYTSDLKDADNSGVFQCLSKCKGTCVEYGITGDAYCFPKK
jgi:hypothetical protein